MSRSHDTSITSLAATVLNNSKACLIDRSKKNRSAMRTWGLMLNFIHFGWNAVLKYQDLGVDLLQVKR